jgi:hypothetical protein
MQPVVRSESPVSVERAANTGRHLDILYEFGNAGPLERAGLYERASTAAVIEPTASNLLQLALLKAWPGHPGYNPEAARQMLQTALAQRHELSPEAQTLAGVHLLIVDQHIQSLNRNRVLLSELDEARDKLEALTRIERTVETAPRAEVAPEPVP